MAPCLIRIVTIAPCGAATKSLITVNLPLRTWTSAVSSEVTSGPTGGLPVTWAVFVKSFVTFAIEQL